MEFSLNFAGLRLLRTSEGSGSPQFKAGCSRSLEYCMIARIAALLACRAHEQVLPVMYDDYATAQQSSSGRSIILFCVLS